MFSKATEYALRATIYIAQKGNEENKIGLAEIAKAIGSPRSFTAKILQLLAAKNGLIQSSPGPNGGFYISDRAKKLSTCKILEVMGENEVLERCILGLKQCSETKPCPMHKQYKSIKLQLMQLFETKTIQSLAEEMKNGEVFVNSKG